LQSYSTSKKGAIFYASQSSCQLATSSQLFWVANFPTSFQLLRLVGCGL